MATYDIVMLIVFLGAVIFGAWKGLAWQVASLSAVVVSYLVAINFREPVAQYISEEPWSKFAAMLVLYLGTSMAIWLVFGRIKETIKRLHLGGFDWQAGALLGALKGALLCMVVTMFSVTLLGDTTTQAVCNSRSGGYIARGINQLTTLVPPEIHDVLNPYVENFNQALEGKSQTQYVDRNNEFPQSPFGGNSTGQSQPIYGGQQSNNAQSQSQNQFGAFNPYRQTGTNQNYQGQWQQPSNANQGYSNPTQGYQTGNQQNGYLPNGQRPVVTQGQNGFPEVNLQINTKDLLDAGAEAAREAARKYFELPPNGQPNSNR